MQAEEVVHFVLGGVDCVVACCVGSDGAFEQGVAGLHCVEDVWWEVEVADSWGGLCSSLGRGCWDGEDGCSREDGGLRYGRCTY
jgi:hypothetical protein